MAAKLKRLAIGYYSFIAFLLVILVAKASCEADLDPSNGEYLGLYDYPSDNVNDASYVSDEELLLFTGESSGDDTDLSLSLADEDNQDDQADSADSSDSGEAEDPVNPGATVPAPVDGSDENEGPTSPTEGDDECVHFHPEPITVETELNCTFDCKAPREPKPSPNVTPLQLVFLIDTSDSMQSKSSNHMYSITTWIYSMVRRLQKANQEQAKKANQDDDKSNFVVVLQFADKTFLEYANDINTDDLEAKFQASLDSILQNQQETTTNTFQALSHLVDLLDIEKTDSKIEELASNDANDSKSVNGTIWKESSEDDETKRLLFIITDGHVRDEIEPFNEQHKDKNGLIPAVGDSFDRIDILIVNTDLPDVDPNLRELAKYNGYLDVWSDPRRILAGIEEMAASIQEYVANSHSEVEVVFVIEKSFCQCKLLTSAQYMYNHIMQFIKKLSVKFHRKRKESFVSFHMMEYFSRLNHEADAECKVSAKKDIYGDPDSTYWNKCCTNDKRIVTSGGKAKNYLEFKEVIEGNTFFSQNEYTCSQIDIDYMLAEAHKMFKCREDGQKKCQKLMVVATSGDDKNTIWMSKTKIRTAIVEDGIEIMPIKIGAVINTVSKTGLSSQSSVSASNTISKNKLWNIQEMATFRPSRFAYIDAHDAPSGKPRNIYNVNLALSQMTSLVEFENSEESGIEKSQIDADSITCGLTCEPLDSQDVIPPTGRCGYTGPNGPKGIDGVTGPVGWSGLKGKDGKEGKAGSRGKYGPVGLKGYKGRKGKFGKPGQDGVPGEKGEVGEPGDKGTPGHQYSDNQLANMIKSMCTCTKRPCGVDEDEPDIVPTCFKTKVLYVVDATESLRNNAGNWQKMLEDSKTFAERLVEDWKDFISSNRESTDSSINPSQFPTLDFEVHAIGLRAPYPEDSNGQQPYTAKKSFKINGANDNWRDNDFSGQFGTEVMNFIMNLPEKVTGGSISEITSVLTKVLEEDADEDTSYINIMAIVSDSFSARDLKQFCSDELTHGCIQPDTDTFPDDANYKYHSPDHVNTGLIDQSQVDDLREKFKKRTDFIITYNLNINKLGESNDPEDSENDREENQKTKEFWEGLLNLTDEESNTNRFESRKLVAVRAKLNDDTRKLVNDLILPSVRNNVKEVCPQQISNPRRENDQENAFKSRRVNKELLGNDSIDSKEKKEEIK